MQKRKRLRNAGKFMMALVASSTAAGWAAMPELEPCFSSAQVEKGAPALKWTAGADGWESTVLDEKTAGLDLAGVTLSRKVTDLAQPKSAPCRVVTYRLANGTKGLRYASFGWRTSFAATPSGDRNWFPTTENVLDLSGEPSLWGFYTKPGPWLFGLVEPWFAVYNPKAKSGCAFLFDFNTLSAAYGAKDMKTRGVLFDGGMLPPGASCTIATTIRELKGLSSVATVNAAFAAGFSVSPTAPALEIQSFADQAIAGTARHADVTGKELGAAEVKATLKAGETATVCAIKGKKPETQSVLSVDAACLPRQDGRVGSHADADRSPRLQFELFRENGIRMAALPLVPAEWTHRRPLPAKVLPASASVAFAPKDKALLLFGFFANFFRFEQMFPGLKFTTVPAIPQGIDNVPPASTLGEYRMIFLGDVNEESVRPMIARLAAYVKNGGTLVVGGGPFAFGCGGYAGSFLGEMMPVVSKPFDCLSACKTDRDGRTAVAIEGMDAKVFWIQRTPPKKGADVLMKTSAGDPLLVKGRYGKGSVYAFLGAPIGDESRDAKAFWNNNADYLKVMREKVR